MCFPSSTSLRDQVVFCRQHIFVFPLRKLFLTLRAELHLFIQLWCSNHQSPVFTFLCQIIVQHGSVITRLCNCLTASEAIEERNAVLHQRHHFDFCLFYDPADSLNKHLCFYFYFLEDYAPFREEHGVVKSVCGLPACVTTFVLAVLSTTGVIS